MIREVAVRAAKAPERLDVRQEFTPWKWDGIRKCYYALWFFKVDPDGELYRRQVIFWYPDPVRRRFVYFYSVEKDRFWGCCTTIYHVEGPGEWHLKKGNDFEPADGPPPIPGADDRAAVETPPEPPPVRG